MPIRPENKNRYPSNWKQIRQDILKRANNKCEFCGIENGSIFLDYLNAKTRTYTQPSNKVSYIIMKEFLKRYPKRFITRLSTGELLEIKQGVVVLTIAHLDHTPENCDPSNLRALCQRCHNRYDAKHRAETKKIKNFQKK